MEEFQSNTRGMNSPMLESSAGESVNVSEEQLDETCNNVSIDNLEQYLQPATFINEASTSKAKALELCKQIEATLLNCKSASAINNGIKHLNAALMVIRSMDNNQIKAEILHFLSAKDQHRMLIAIISFVLSLQKGRKKVDGKLCQNQAKMRRKIASKI